MSISSISSISILRVSKHCIILFSCTLGNFSFVCLALSLRDILGTGTYVRTGNFETKKLERKICDIVRTLETNRLNIVYSIMY